MVLEDLAVAVAGALDCGPALLYVLGPRVPDGLAEPIARAILADWNTTTGTVPIGVPSDESAASQARGRATLDEKEGGCYELHGQVQE